LSQVCPSGGKRAAIDPSNGRFTDPVFAAQTFPAQQYEEYATKEAHGRADHCDAEGARGLACAVINHDQNAHATVIEFASHPSA
jgi:hypothetical protein